MSLSNEMLKNLDARRAVGRDMSEVTADLIASQKARSHHAYTTYSMMILGFLVLLLTVMLIGDRLHLNVNVRLSRPATAMIPTSTVLAPVVKKIAQAPIQMSTSTLKMMAKSNAEL